MRNIVAMLFLAAVLSMTACGTKESKWENQNVKAFAETLARKDVQIVDVRTPGEFSAGHIEGAVNIDVTSSDFQMKADSLLESGRPVAVYCRSGNRSTKAVRILSEKGFKTIYHLENGMKSWMESRMPVISGSGIDTMKVK